MLYAVMPKQDYEHACDVLREYTGESEPIKSGDLEENIDKVFVAGTAAGEEKGYGNGYNAGHVAGVAEGVAKTNSATLTPNKAAEGEIFWAGGREQVGTVKVALGGISQVVTPNKGYNGSEECVVLSHTLGERLFLNPDQGGIALKAHYSDFGDAENKHVTKGKIFTSKSGFREVGTHAEPTFTLNNGVLRIR